MAKKDTGAHMPPFDGKESAAAWDEFYARPMPKRSSIRTLQQRVLESRGQISTTEVKPKKKVKGIRRK